MKGAILKTTNGIDGAILDFLKKALDKNLFDALLIPVKVPAGDSYAWILLEDKSLLEEASPLPPIMSVQGAKALSSVTRRGKLNKKIAAILRPCEVRAAIELSKLEQVELENVFLISVDCPGVLPLKEYLGNPEKAEDTFKKVINEWGNQAVRPMCQICERFANGPADLHIGILGAKKGDVYLIPNTPKGENIIKGLDTEAKEPTDDWEAKVKQLVEVRKRKKKEVQEEFKSKVAGLDKLLETFSKCINCHNCRSVCPICYCRQCYFDSEKLKLPSDDYLLRAEKKESMRFLPDTLLFQLGRMSHMSLSCVGCGACEDACPMSIEVARIFSLAAEKTQEVFDYVPGKSVEEPLPLKVYKEDEFHEVEV